MDGSIVILNKKGKYLLQLRDDVKEINNPNCWGFFGGCIEEGEAPRNTAIREIKEELNLDISQDQMDFIGERKEKIGSVFVFECLLRSSLNDLDLLEGADMKLFHPEEILKLENTAPGLKSFTRKFLI